MRVKVETWGDGLAVRLPAEVVEALGLKEGDEVRIEAADPHMLYVTRDVTRDEALARLRALAWPLPSGFKFSRDEANERGP